MRRPSKKENFTLTFVKSKSKRGSLKHPKGLTFGKVKNKMCLQLTKNAPAEV